MVEVITWECRLTEADQPFRFFLFSGLRISGQVIRSRKWSRHGKQCTRFLRYMPFDLWFSLEGVLKDNDYLRVSSWQLQFVQ